jgi:hypothetical protein
MGNKMKKLICALLASAMLVSSVGMVAFADDETTTDAAAVTTSEETETPEATEATEVSEETETTETTEATEASEETQTSTVSSSKYDSDSYYQKALALCSSLGIISGYEDGSVKPDSKVTRAEMASIVLRMLAISSTSAYQNGFTDVSASHWAADQIQTAQEQNIVSGMGDGTFVPDGDVTYAQVVVMLVNAMNYQDDAAYYTSTSSGGHWASGYLKAAANTDLDLLKNAAGETDEAADRGLVIKMVYNALLGQYKELNGTDDNGNLVYRATETLAKAKFDVIDKKGVLIGTSKTTIGSKDLTDGQLEILEDKQDKSEVFESELTGLEDYIAQKITYYYRENSGRSSEVLAVTYDASKSETYEIKDPDDIEKVEGFDTLTGSYKVSGVSKAKDCSGATIIYNGKVVTDAQLEELGDDINDLMIPEKGSVKLVDSDKDNTYDVVFVESYETVQVVSTSTDRLTGKISAATSTDDLGTTTAYSLNLDDSEDRTVTVTKGGVEAKLRNLKKDDVASIKRSIDNTVVDIVVTGESITGKASGITKKFDASKATVNGVSYEVANIAAGDLKNGTDAVFYLDMFGRIAFIESTGSGKLQTGEKYGWIMSAYEAENGDDYIVQIMTSDGKAVEFDAGTNLDYWAPDATSSTTLKGNDVDTTIAALMSGSSFIKATSINTPIRLVKYKANSSNTLTRLYCAVDSTKVSDEDALRINPQNLTGSGYAVVAGLVGGNKINDGILEIAVPKNVSDMKDSSNYKFGTVTSSTYVVRENGSSRDYVVGEFEDTNAPTVLIYFTSSSDALADLGDIDTNANNPVMVVDEIERGVDDEDNTVYTVSGYVNGAEASFTTTKNTVLGKLDTSSAIINSARDYNTKSLWNARSDESLTNYLSEGDLVLYDGGERLIQLIDTDDIYNVVQKGASNSNLLVDKGCNPFAARNMFVCGALLESDLTDTARISLDTSVLSDISFDASKLMDTIEINVKDGKASIDTDGSEIADLVDFDATDKTGDYIFARFADKGTLQEVVVYRFVK